MPPLRPAASERCRDQHRQHEQRHLEVRARCQRARVADLGQAARGEERHSRRGRQPTGEGAGGFSAEQRGRPPAQREEGDRHHRQHGDAPKVGSPHHLRSVVVRGKTAAAPCDVFSGERPGRVSTGEVGVGVLAVARCPRATSSGVTQPLGGDPGGRSGRATTGDLGSAGRSRGQSVPPGLSAWTGPRGGHLCYRRRAGRSLRQPPAVGLVDGCRVEAESSTTWPGLIRLW
jgi:hypothetical protein